MTEPERREFVKMVRALDLAVRSVPDSVWPLCWPALELMRLVDRGRRMRPCLMPTCRLASGHRCSCEVRSVRRGLELRHERGRHA